MLNSRKINHFSLFVVVDLHAASVEGDLCASARRKQYSIVYDWIPKWLDAIVPHQWSVGWIHEHFATDSPEIVFFFFHFSAVIHCLQHCWMQFDRVAIKMSTFVCRERLAVSVWCHWVRRSTKKPKPICFGWWFIIISIRWNALKYSNDSMQTFRTADSTIVLRKR